MLGDQIRAFREEKCWSQAHLADASGLNVRTIQRIEAGEPCSYETMMSLAAALGVDLKVFDQSASVVKSRRAALAGRRAVAAICLAPPTLFIALNLLRSIAGVTAPYDFAARAGSEIMSFQAFNLLSPVIFLGGAAVALVATVPALLRLRSKKDGSTLSITGVEVKGDWASFALAMIAICCMTTLLAYAAVEKVFSTVH